MEYLDFDSYQNLPSSQQLVSGTSPVAIVASDCMSSAQKFSDAVLVASNNSWTTDCSLPLESEHEHFSTGSNQPLSIGRQPSSFNQIEGESSNHNRIAWVQPSLYAQSTPLPCYSLNNREQTNIASTSFHHFRSELLSASARKPSNRVIPSQYRRIITDRFVPSRLESKFSTYSAHETTSESDENNRNGFSNCSSNSNSNSSNTCSTNAMNSDVRFKNAVDRDEVNQVSLSSLYKNYILGIREKKRDALTSSNAAFASFQNSNVLRFSRSQQTDLTPEARMAAANQQPYLDYFVDQSKMQDTFGNCRKISRNPSKVLDAPALQDDFYLNLIDWSAQNVLAVGLSSCVYLWSACNSHVTKLCDYGRQNEVTSVSWSTQGSPLLSIGRNSGDVEIWDTVKQEKVRVMNGHSQRVGTLAWSPSLLSSGSRDKSILQRDLRTRRAFECKLTGHKQEVCGLKWSFDDQQLASGGNDNKLFLWNVRQNRPLEKFSNHNAAVKALAWSPHQHGLLASGGGTQDRTIRFWNTLTCKQLECVETGSQVCNLIFSKTVNELVSTHGYSQNQVVVWNYPDMEKLATLVGHQNRVLYLAMSPDGSTIVTGAGDETLRFWNVFPEANSAYCAGEGNESMLLEENLYKTSCIR